MDNNNIWSDCKDFLDGINFCINFLFFLFLLFFIDSLFYGRNNWRYVFKVDFVVFKEKVRIICESKLF